MAFSEGIALKVLGVLTARQTPASHQAAKPHQLVAYYLTEFISCSTILRRVELDPFAYCFLCTVFK